MSTKKKALTIPKSGQVAKRPPTTIVQYEPKEVDEESTWGFPQAIQDAQGETGSSVKMEWSPASPGELLVGRILSINTMGLGGIAYVFNINPDTTGKPLAVLLKKGGKVLENRMAALGAGIGDLFAVLYVGEEPTEFKNAMRLWKVKKITGELPVEAFAN